MSLASPEGARDTKLERRLAVVLQVGTWSASAVVGAGLVLSSTNVVTAGIGLFIALPIVCVALMLLWFLRRRDYRIALVAALVLTVIAVAFVAGMRSSGSLG